MTDPNLELHGIDAPLEAEIVLRAGPFEAIFEPTRAYLRRVRIHGVESVRVVYLHARAPDWSTVVPAVSNLESSIGQDRFELTWTGLHRKGEINFEWKGTLTGTAEGITYRCEGVALSEFKTNRTGMCALIPREFQGLPATIRHPDETESAITMPTTVSPTEPVRLARSIELGGVKLTFEGDVYGAEDQRNWSDASFKAYSMRGRGGAAYTLMKGEKLTHSLRIEASKTEAPGPAAVSKAGSPLLGARLDNDHDDIGNLPVDFFRVELPAGEDEARHLLDHARGSGRPLQIVAPHGGKAPDTRDHETLILMNAKERPSSSTSAWLGAGAFSEFNMGRHEAKGFDGLEVTVTPQVHTFDERSILENAFTLTDILQTLAAIAPGAGLGLDVHLSGEGADPRLGSLFGALWILRCYASAAEFGLSLLTVASTSDMRHPALAALARTLTGRDRFHAGRTALSAEQVVLHAESGAILVGNLLRSSQALPASFELVHHRTLSPTGWRDGAGPLREMGPYEVVLLG